jgi:ribonuclease VapC
MFVDASALVAIITSEPDGPALAKRLNASEPRYISPVAIYETAMALLRLRDGTIDAAMALIDDFLQHSRIGTIPITDEIGRNALDAFARYGRGRHPARLNMGDCFAYACARSLGVPLLCKGDDFAQTDITLA